MYYIIITYILYVFIYINLFNLIDKTKTKPNESQSKRTFDLVGGVFSELLFNQREKTSIHSISPVNPGFSQNISPIKSPSKLISEDKNRNKDLENDDDKLNFSPTHQTVNLKVQVDY